MHNLHIIQKLPLFACALVSVLASFLAALPAFGDSMQFNGNEPVERHIWLPLDETQKKQVAAAKTQTDEDGGYSFKSLEIILNQRQQEEIYRATKKRITWVRASSQGALSHDCTCGSHNTAVLEPHRIAVMLNDLDPLAVSQKQLTDFSRRFVRNNPTPASTHKVEISYDYLELDRYQSTLEIKDGIAAAVKTEEGPVGDLMRRHLDLLTLFPPDQIPDPLDMPLPKDWRTADWRTAEIVYSENPMEFGLPLEGEDQGFGCFDERIFTVKPSKATRPKWPETAAVRLNGPMGTDDYLIPTLIAGEIGPKHPAWLLLSYKNGVLGAVFLLNAEKDEKPGIKGLLIDGLDIHDGLKAKMLLFLSVCNDGGIYRLEYMDKAP